MKNILITGGSGFIGANLVHRLSQLDQYKITVLDITPPRFMTFPDHVRFIKSDLRDSDKLKKIIIDDSIETIYHLAWGTIHETATRDPLGDIHENVDSSLKLFDACVNSKVTRIIYISSGGTVYGVPKQLPVNETHMTNPINAFGISKLTVEKYLQMYAHLHHIEYTIFRPSVLYGPYQNPNRRQSAVTVFTYNALTGKTIHIWGSGDIIRDFFYIDDLIDVLISALSVSECKNKIFNLSGNRAIRLNEVINTIKQILKIIPVVRYEESRLIDVKEMILDSSSARNLLNWVPKTNLDKGICLTAEWLKRYFPT
ncbi:NAD-dependent epimerase/dehydratase family protein [bacterium]|nr:NAD-dependent epimerase/dehydratase family protein [bacterium]